MNDAGKPVLVPYRWVVLAVAMLAGFIGSYAQFQLPPLAYKLIPALHISSSQFAALMGGPMTAAIFISILGGALADRYGVKNIVTVGLVLAVIGCTFRYAVTSFWPFFLLTVLAGLASALLVSNLSKLFGAWFPPEQMGTVMGICMISPMLAGFSADGYYGALSIRCKRLYFFGRGLLCDSHPMADPRQKQTGGRTGNADFARNPVSRQRHRRAKAFCWPASARFL